MNNSKIFLMVIGAIYLFVCLTTMYIFPLMARFENTLVQTVKNALLMSILHIFKTIVMAIPHIIFKGDCLPGAKNVKTVQKERIAHRFHTLHHGIVVIQYEAFVFQHFSAPFAGKFRGFRGEYGFDTCPAAG